MVDSEEHRPGRLADEKGIAGHKEDIHEETLRVAAERGHAATDRYYRWNVFFTHHKLMFCLATASP